MPLDRVRRNAQTAGQARRVKPLRKQVENLQLPSRELGSAPDAVSMFDARIFLARNGFCEQRRRNEDLTSPATADRLDDLIGVRRFGQVGCGAGVNGIKQSRLGLFGAVEDDRHVWTVRANLRRRSRPAHVWKLE